MPPSVFEAGVNVGPNNTRFANNFNARTDYEDWPEPDRKRDLLRLWLTVRRPLDLPADFATGGITSRTAAFDG